LAPFWDDSAHRLAVEREDDDRAVLLASWGASWRSTGWPCAHAGSDGRCPTT